VAASRKVLYTITWMEVGGSQTHLLEVFRLLDRRRFEPLLYCLTGQGALLPAVTELGVRVIDGGIREGFRSPYVLAGLRRLIHVIRRERIDIVHNYLIRANIVGAMAGRLAGAPVVLCSKRGCHERRGWELAGVWVANRLAHCVTTNAEAVREFVHANERCPKAKMVVIPSGVDTDRFRPQDRAAAKRRIGLHPERPVVGIVTRMRTRKGVEEFLGAMIRVRAAHPDAHAVVVGEVELDATLEQLVHSAGLRDHLTLLGRRSDMPQVLASFDVFVLSSHDEGMSNAILEAMAMERAVVATDVGGTNEVVRNGETGLLVPAKDPAPLADAIGTLLADPETCARMGRRGRAVVCERFSARAMVQQMEHLYDDLLRTHGAARGAAVADARHAGISPS
jgi:glycosyltransferase involved in cell wall biosynthesis